MENNVVDLGRYRFVRKRSQDIEKLKDVLVSLRESYETLKPFIKYPLIANIGTSILMARKQVVTSIEQLQAQEKEDEAIYSK